MVTRANSLPLLVDREAVAADWRARGYTPGATMYPPGRERRESVRRRDALLMLVEGQVEIEIEGETYLPEPGQELRIPAGTRHSIRNTGHRVSRWLHAYRN